MATVQFGITVKHGPREVVKITGRNDVLTTDMLTVQDVQRIPEVEAFLERLTGLRFHIEQLHDDVRSTTPENDSEYVSEFGRESRHNHDRR